MPHRCNGPQPVGERVGWSNQRAGAIVFCQSDQGPSDPFNACDGPCYRSLMGRALAGFGLVLLAFGCSSEDGAPGQAAGATDQRATTTASAPDRQATAVTQPPVLSPGPSEPVVNWNVDQAVGTVQPFGQAASLPCAGQAGQGISEADVSETLRGLRGGEPPLNHTPADLAAVIACKTSRRELAQAYNLGGLARHRGGDYSKSAVMWASAVQVDPSYAAARFNLACSLARLGRADDAIVQLRELVRAGPEGEEWRRRASRDTDLESLRARQDFRAIVLEPEPTVAGGGRPEPSDNTGPNCGPDPAAYCVSQRVDEGEVARACAADIQNASDPEGCRERWRRNAILCCMGEPSTLTASDLVRVGTPSREAMILVESGALSDLSCHYFSRPPCR